jgi:hypothetical protein
LPPCGLARCGFRVDLQPRILQTLVLLPTDLKGFLDRSQSLSKASLAAATFYRKGEMRLPSVGVAAEIDKRIWQFNCLAGP